MTGRLGDVVEVGVERSGGVNAVKTWLTDYKLTFCGIIFKRVWIRFDINVTKITP